VTQDPETKEYMIVMQYANNGARLKRGQITWFFTESTGK